MPLKLLLLSYKFSASAAAETYSPLSEDLGQYFRGLIAANIALSKVRDKIAGSKTSGVK